MFHDKYIMSFFLYLFPCRRLNDNEIVVLEAAGIFKKLPNLKKMYVYFLFLSWVLMNRRCRKDCEYDVFGAEGYLTSCHMGFYSRAVFLGERSIDEMKQVQIELSNI